MGRDMGYAEKMSNLRSLANFFYLLVFLGILSYWSFLCLEKQHTFTIKTVRVATTFTHIEPKVLQSLIAPYVKENFFVFKSEQMAMSLMTIPWVHDIAVQKNWPGIIALNITEQVPVVEWNRHALLNEQGEIFVTNIQNFAPNLPQIIGPDGSAKNILRIFLSMNQLLKSHLNYSITLLHVDEQGVWHLTLNNDLNLLLEEQDILRRLEIFVKIYPKIKSTHKTARSVDLRYKNGFAIQWEEERKPINTTPKTNLNKENL